MSNPTEKHMRLLPEVITIGGMNYSLKIGKTGDGSGKLSRCYVGYTRPNTIPYCWYEESTFDTATKRALEKILLDPEVSL